MPLGINMDKQILLHIQNARHLIGTILDDEVYEDDKDSVLSEAIESLDKILGFVIQ